MERKDWSKSHCLITHCPPRSPGISLFLRRSPSPSLSLLASTTCTGERELRTELRASEHSAQTKTNGENKTAFSSSLFTATAAHGQTDMHTHTHTHRLWTGKQRNRVSQVSAGPAAAATTCLPASVPPQSPPVPSTKGTYRTTAAASRASGASVD